MRGLGLGWFRELWMTETSAVGRCGPKHPGRRTDEGVCPYVGHLRGWQSSHHARNRQRSPV